MFQWLARRCYGKSIAEISIWYTVTAVGGFVAITLLWALLDGLSGRSEEDLPSDAYMVCYLIALLLWAIWLVWLWIGLVRTVWRWSHERLGTPVFRILQIGFCVMTLVSALAHGEIREDLSILLLVILAFDVAVLIMIVNFLCLAWFARCRIPVNEYWEIGTIVTMIVVQLIVFV